MAKVTAPLLSMGARGAIGKTLVMSAWKGIATARQYVVPANPNTAGQQAQRAIIGAAVAAFRNVFTAAGTRTAWNRYALTLSSAMSGANAFIGALAKVIGGNAAASFGTACVITTHHTVVTMVNADDGATGDEAGDFEVWRGTTRTNLVLTDTVAIAAGSLTGSSSTSDNVKYYVQVRKDGIARSGIFEVTDA